MSTPEEKQENARLREHLARLVAPSSDKRQQHAILPDRIESGHLPTVEQAQAMGRVGVVGVMRQSAHLFYSVHYSAGLVRQRQRMMLAH